MNTYSTAFFSNKNIPVSSFSNSNQISNLMLRSDGFKKVVKGLSYNNNSNNNFSNMKRSTPNLFTNSPQNILRSGQQTYTSAGKRSQMFHYELGK
jgi:hypothetical protein